jgi:hypothetical protein
MLLMPLLEVFCTFEYSTFQWLTGIQYKLHCHEVIKKAMRGTCTLISLPRCSVGGLPALFGLYGNRYRWEDTETTSSITRSISITELTKCKKKTKITPNQPTSLRSSKAKEINTLQPEASPTPPQANQHRSPRAHVASLHAHRKTSAYQNL